ncbi:hypothetical protein Emed_001158 [Eimeria media]
MRWLRPAAVVLLLSLSFLALQGPHATLCDASAVAETALPAEAVEAEAPPAAAAAANEEEDAFAYGPNDNEPLSNEEEDEGDGYMRDAAGSGVDRPRDERPRTTKRLYTTRRTNQATNAARNQQLVKLKLAAFGAVVLLALLAVAFRGKFASDDDEDDS